MSRLAAIGLSLALVCTGCSFADLGASNPPGASSGVSGTPSAAAAPPATSPTATPSMRPTPRPTPRPTRRPTPAPTAPGGIQVLAVGARDRSPDVAPADLRAVVQGNTAFAFDLYRQLRRSQHGNITVGPYSISVAFAMQAAGARGRTADQIDRVLHFTLPTARLDAAFNELAVQLASRQNKWVTLSMANRLFGAQLFPFRTSYLREITRNFAAPLAAVDFFGDPEAARKLINRWVARQTADRIRDLVPKGAVKKDTMLALVNAVYLNARWADQFDPNDTRDARFTRPDGSHVQVPTMFRDDTMAVTIRDDYVAVELPYRGDKLAMLVVMPKPGTFASFERSLDPAGLQRIVTRLHQLRTRLDLPAFSIRTRLSLGDLLQTMGIRDAFDSDLADLYGISAVRPGDDPRLFISKVFHQAFIKVAEKGTEAAAATVILDEGTTGGDEGTVSVNIDHPFLWFIRDRVTGTILFMGRVVDPSVTAR